MGLTGEQLIREDEEFGMFPRGIKNIHVTGTYGHSSVPDAIVRACVILARNENDGTLYTHYIQGKENAGGYDYDFKGKVMTGVYDADIILKDYIRQKGLFAVV